jgi:uncharacterized protein (DUF488 family)
MTGGPSLLTIGYEGRTAAQLIGQLADRGVDVVVDVRLTPVSRKAGLSKRSLAGATEAVGMSYLYMPELGNPRDNRDPLRAGEPIARRRFQQRLRTAAAATAVRHLADLAAASTVALLCYERDHRTCHRQLIVNEAQRVNPALVVEHTP